ncbi:hypothetical protein [Halolamina rubra]|uniref:hypothetical protein n=1 Tax=Halolamina rubra TaxID=1380430 RepID=UPI00067914E4|nr:hypothetical protein [Halolamina rubra]
MRATKAVAFTMAAMLLLAGTVAVGAAAPADQANSTAGNAPADDADADDPAADDDRPDEVGPSGGLPDAVPDHVDGIHQRIGSFLDGSIDDLGSSLSDYLGDGEQAENEQSDAADGESDA